jgi:hypothetical protein
MADYQLTAPMTGGIVIRLDDQAHIPPDPANADYVDYLQWVEDGGVPYPYQPPPEPAPTPPAPEVVDVVMLDHENRLRAIEGQPPLTREQFRRMIDGV